MIVQAYYVVLQNPQISFQNYTHLFQAHIPTNAKHRSLAASRRHCTTGWCFFHMVWRRICLLKGGCCHELDKSGRLSPSKLRFSDNEHLLQVEMRLEPSGLLCKHCTAAVHLLCDRRRLLWKGAVWATSAGISNATQNLSSRFLVGKHLPEQQERRTIFITCIGGVIFFFDKYIDKPNLLLRLILSMCGPEQYDISIVW